MDSRSEGEPVDGGLVARVADGDEAAFMTVYDRHVDAVFGTTVRFLGDREAAAEVVQDVFLAVWRRAWQYDPRSGSVFGWIVGIARHRSIDRLRADSRRPRLAAVQPGETGSGGIDDLLDLARRSVDGGDGDPAIELDRRWARAQVRVALSEMPIDERRVLVLAYDGALSQSEIASRIGVPIGTVKSRTRRGLARLRAHLADVPDLRPSDHGRPTGAVPSPMIEETGR